MDGSAPAATQPQLREAARSSPALSRLGVEALDLLCRDMAPLRLPAGEVVFQQGEIGDALYLVVSGELLSTGEAVEGVPAERKLGPGELVGEVEILVGGLRATTVRAVADTVLARLEKPALERLASEIPGLVLALGDLIRKRLREEQLARVLRQVFGELDPAALRHMEEELEWVALRPGEALFEQDEASDSMYLVVSGRLIGVRASGSERRIVTEVGRGETIGEMGFFTGEPRSASIYARRGTHLVRFLKPVFDRLSREHPRAMLYITQLLIRRLRRTSGFTRESFERSNVVVLPIGGAPAADFTRRLVEALRGHGKTLYVNAERLDEFVGVPGFAQTRADGPLDLALDAALDDRESACPYAVYECDAEDTPWTRRCIERADRILLLADPSADPAPSLTEQALLAGQTGLTAARRALVLLHPETTSIPTRTRFWLKPRRLDAHHHLRRDRDADFARLARFLTGNAIGAVLGGGGARGFAHLGAIRALREAGVPIDLIGGTSMGALIAVQPALGWDDATMLQANRRAFVERKPVSVLDYTVPVYALVGGTRLDRSLVGPLGDTRIEDLWTGYFCVSSNLTRAVAKVHQAGPVWKAIRASLSLPGIFQPVLERSDLLVDGGVLNNLPGDVMRELGGGWVIAVDVSPARDLEIAHAVLPSPWRVLLGWLNPFAKPSELNIVKLMMRTTLLASVQKTEAVKKLVDLYIQPPVNRFGLMQFHALDEIAEAGYGHARTEIEAWLKQQPQLARLLRAPQAPPEPYSQR